MKLLDGFPDLGLRGERAFFAVLFCCLALLLFFVTSSSFANPGIGNISSVSIRSDGWSADVNIVGFVPGGKTNFGLGTNNDISNAAMVFTVTSNGFDASGNPTTITRTV